MTQSQLALHLGVNRSAVAQWEREAGGTHPSLAHLAEIAIATAVPFEWIATGRGNGDGAELLEVPAVALEYATDEWEVRALSALRQLSVKKKIVICRLLDEFAGGNAGWLER